MPIAFYIAPYKRRAGALTPTRYCAIDDFTAQVDAWAESEVLGDRAVVKVRASATILSAINAEPGFIRLPKDALDNPLSDLSAGQKTALRNLLTDMGYTLAEIQARFGADLGTHTLGDVLRFMASRRLKPRYDQGADQIILDGPVQSCRSIDHVDAGVA